MTDALTGSKDPLMLTQVMENGRWTSNTAEKISPPKPEGKLVFKKVMKMTAKIARPSKQSEEGRRKRWRCVRQ